MVATASRSFTEEISRSTGRPLHVRDRYFALRQEAVNRDAVRYGLDRGADAARMVARSCHKAYPQYRGHWDAWTLVQMRRGVRTKMGIALVPGDFVLVAPKDHPFTKIVGSQSFHSIRNQCDTSF